MHRGAAQPFAGSRTDLGVQLPLEGHRLLTVEAGEIPVAGGLFEPAEGLGDAIDRLGVSPPSVSQVAKIRALDPLVGRVVFGHDYSSRFNARFGEAFRHPDMRGAAL